MGIEEQPSLIHWNYFLALEEDIEHLARYVEFTTSNFSTYSLEIAHIYLAACSEVDVVAKQLSRKIDPDSNPRNIDDYRRIIDSAIPSIKNEKVTLHRYGLDLNPWDNWNEEQSPLWWRSHNAVKHERHNNFDKANLKNVLNAMSGLFLLILHYYKDLPVCDRIEPPPSIFTPPAEVGIICPTHGGRMIMAFDV